MTADVVAESQGRSDAPPAKGPGKLALLLVATVALLVGGMVGGFVAGPLLADHVGGAGHVVDETESPAESHQSTPKPAAVYEIPNVVVNPYGTRGMRFLIVSLSLELDSPETAELLEDREAEVRDRLLRILGGKTVEELAAVDLRDGLREELIETVQQVLNGGKVLRMHLPQFVIQ